MTKLQQQLVTEILRLTEENRLIAVDTFVGELLSADQTPEQSLEKKPQLQETRKRDL